MTNKINSGSLQGLQMNQTLLVSARKVAGNKLQLEFAEVVKTQSNAANPIALFNKSDDRFSQGNGARRAWLTAEAKDASQYLDLDLTDSNPNWFVDQMGREILPLNIINPVASIAGEIISLKVEVIETVTPSEWQSMNLETSAKRKGKDGAFITHKGMYIFANTRIAFHKATHVFLDVDQTTTTTNNGILAGVDLSTGEIFN